MQCQVPDCKKHVKWRIVDYYTQGSMTFTYSYYLCDDHKNDNNLPGHRKEITLYSE